MIFFIAYKLKLNIFYKIIFLFFLLKIASASENIKIQNKIFVLDIYGNRYLASKNKQIKSGDFLKSTNNPAMLIINNNKICFSKNSSLKIEKFSLNNDKIDFKILNGKFLIKKDAKSKFLLNIKFNSTVLKNTYEYFYIQKGLFNSFLVEKITKENSITKEFLDNCFQKIKDLNPSKKTEFRCFPKNNKLVCDHKKSF